MTAPPCVALSILTQTHSGLTLLSTIAFFTSLRSNLSLPDTDISPYPSPSIAPLSTSEVDVLALPPTHTHHDEHVQPCHPVVNLASYTFPATPPHKIPRLRTWSSSSSSTAMSSATSSTSHSPTQSVSDEIKTLEKEQRHTHTRLKSQSISDTKVNRKNSSISKNSHHLILRRDFNTPLPVTITLSHDPEDTSQALRLLANTIVEQRHLATRALLTHPLTLLLLSLLVMLSSRLLYRSRADVPRAIGANVLILLCAIVVAKLIGWGYVPYAREVLDGRTGDDDRAWLGADEVLIAKVAEPDVLHRDIWHKLAPPWVWKMLPKSRKPMSATAYADNLAHPLRDCNEFADGGNTITTDDLNQYNSEEKIVGVLVLSWHPHSGKLGRKGRRVGRGWIRGWAVDNTFRACGIGTLLLSEAARTGSSRGGDGVFFAADHAHSKHVLPRLFTSAFRRRDNWARSKLDDITHQRDRGAGGLLAYSRARRS